MAEKVKKSVRPKTTRKTQVKKTLKADHVSLKAQESLNSLTPGLMIGSFLKGKIFISGAVAGVTLGSVFLFGLAGYGLDKVFNSKPIFFIIALLVSFPISQITIYKVIMKNIQTKL